MPQRLHMMFSLGLLILCLISTLNTYAQQALKNTVGKSQIQTRLFKDFDKRFADPKAYRELVKKECYLFPEGDLFPYNMPLMAYAWRIKAQPQLSAKLKPITDELIKASIEAVELRVNDGRSLMKIKGYRKEAVYLGQLLLTLEVCFQAGLGMEHTRLSDHLADLLSKALKESRGKALNSFPTYSWTFDTSPVIAGLHFHDQRHKATTHQAVIETHLKWLKDATLDKKTQLPASRWKAGRITAPPRGCDLSWRIALLSEIDQSFAEKLYERYNKHYWTKAVGVEGYREWPKGMRPKEDLDSGPMLKDLGTSATVLGMASSRAMGDLERFQLILRQQSTLQALFKLAGARFSLPGDIQVKQ